MILEFSTALIFFVAAPPPPTPFFPLGGVDPCETMELPDAGREAACLEEDASCANAFGQDFGCRYVTGDHCSCVVTPAPGG